jgi:hypothetical protein
MSSETDEHDKVIVPFASTQMTRTTRTVLDDKGREGVYGEDCEIFSTTEGAGMGVSRSLPEFYVSKAQIRVPGSCRMNVASGISDLECNLRFPKAYGKL